jgi:hypothetical protein
MGEVYTQVNCLWITLSKIRIVFKKTFAYPSQHLSSPPVYRGVHFARSLVFCVVFCLITLYDLYIVFLSSISELLLLVTSLISCIVLVNFYSNRNTIVIFRDIDDLVKCYHPKNYEGCSSLQTFVQFVPSQTELRKQFENVCTQKEGNVILLYIYTSKLW